MKYLIIAVMLITLSAYGYGSETDVLEPLSRYDSPIDMPEGGTYIFIFYGDLDLWFTSAGSLIIDCDPPFENRCYTIYWSLNNPTDKTVLLNDINETEISVSSEAVITTQQDGSKRHTFDL